MAKTKKSEMKRLEATRFKHYWMCDACAKEMGGVFPKGHTCTATWGVCLYCQDKGAPEICTTLVPWVDYDWPKSKDITATARANRD